MNPVCSPSGFWQRHLDKIGVGGSLFAALIASSLLNVWIAARAAH